MKPPEKIKKDTSEEQDEHRNNKAEFDAFSEEYLRKYYPFIDPEQIQQILKYYPRSRQEFVITVCLGVLSVICISYFLMTLYRCMCSKKYSKWRASWSKSARKGKMNNYIKQIKDALPIVLKGHLQVCILNFLFHFLGVMNFRFNSKHGQLLRKKTFSGSISLFFFSN